MQVAGVAAVVVAVAALSGCLTDTERTFRPARVHFALASRHLASSAPTDAGTIARQTSPTPPPAAPAASDRAVTGAAQFTMLTRYHAYVGGEVEAGTLGPTGSNFAGAYGIVGGETGNRFGSIAAEAAIGRRTLRADLSAADHVDVVVEPRLRAELWLSSQVTLGGNLGASLGDHAWLAGVYLGVHSNLFDLWR